MYIKTFSYFHCLLELGVPVSVTLLRIQCIQFCHSSWRSLDFLKRGKEWREEHSRLLFAAKQRVEIQCAMWTCFIAWAVISDPVLIVGVGLRLAGTIPGHCHVASDIVREKMRDLIWKLSCLRFGCV